MGPSHGQSRGCAPPAGDSDAEYDDPLAEATLPAASALADELLARIVDGSDYPSDANGELRELLAVFAARALDAATGSDPAPEACRAAGRALADGQLIGPDAAECALTGLGSLLAPAADTPARVVRLTGVISAVARGYAQALRMRALLEHEEITSAALVARRRADEARWASEARFSTLFNASTVGIAVFDPDGTSLDANRAASEMLDIPLDEIRRMTVPEIVPRAQYPDFWADLERLVDGATDQVRLESRHTGANGKTIWLDSMVSAVRRPDGAARYLLAIVHDVTERMQLQERLRHQAGHDPLTGLPNRALFFERLEAATAAAGSGPGPRPGVCYLDLDGFKVVNDTLGHETGDRLLQSLANRLRAALDPQGHMVARMGGDEFVVLVERSPDRRSLERVAELALETVRRSVRIGEHAIAISASVGVVRHDAGDGPQELMKAADTTLYSAKHDGRGRYAVFDRERHRSHVLRFELSAQMPEALRKGHFVVAYQPLVRLADETMVGVEALVRWRRPDGEMIGPDQFIPLAEETGLVVPLGRFVLDEACRQARLWRDADPSHPLLVSVNVASRQVLEGDIAADVADALAAHGLPPESLQLELTERDLMITEDDQTSGLRDVADLGVRIAIDDFGTGYSNLAYLHQLPVHHLKLAGSFVVGSGDRDDVILRALINLAHSLGLDVTAETVETRQQAERLRSYGCTNAQGWYYAPALPPERIPALVDHPFAR